MEETDNNWWKDIILTVIWENEEIQRSITTTVHHFKRHTLAGETYEQQTKKLKLAMTFQEPMLKYL
jgi:hypothetical protein